MPAMHSDWTLFTHLCRIMGGRDDSALPGARREVMLEQLLELARQLALLPALATRIEEHPDGHKHLTQVDAQLLQKALQDNTRDNMHAVQQAVKLSRSLNSRGLTPTFLKGTALLLTTYRHQLGFRRQVDIDLVLAPGELRPACETMLDDGYVFCKPDKRERGEPETFGDLEQAIKTSSAHHHLPPMVKPGCAFSVELHRHHLPARFQRANPLQELLENAQLHQQHNARFRIPRPEHQIIQIILGKLVHDGDAARSVFPIREACDYVELCELLDNVNWVEDLTRQCRKELGIFSRLVQELMGYSGGISIVGQGDIGRRLKLMEARYNSIHIARLLDAQARAIHLGQSMLHSPAKLPKYLQQLINN